MNEKTDSEWSQQNLNSTKAACFLNSLPHVHHNEVGGREGAYTEFINSQMNYSMIPNYSPKWRIHLIFPVTFEFDFPIFLISWVSHMYTVRYDHCPNSFYPPQHITLPTSSPLPFLHKCMGLGPFTKTRILPGDITSKKNNFLPLATIDSLRILSMGWGYRNSDWLSFLHVGNHSYYVFTNEISMMWPEYSISQYSP